jgi:hypothetical protein
MKKEKLTKLCEQYKIPLKKIPEENMDFYRKTYPSEDFMVNNLIEINKLLKNNLIHIGGLSACSQILGFRPMRRVSNDLDFIINEEGIKLLDDYFHEKLFQTLDYYDLFLEYNNIPVGFDIEETHDWKIPGDFFDSIVKLNLEGNIINSISPEYLISLKARRGILKNRFYGKDAIDTINVILGSINKKDLNNLNYDKLSVLLLTHASKDREILSNYLDFVKSYQNKIKKEESIFLIESINSLNSCLNKIY